MDVGFIFSLISWYCFFINKNSSKNSQLRNLFNLIKIAKLKIIIGFDPFIFKEANKYWEQCIITGMVINNDRK